MKTVEQIIALFLNTKPSDWKNHPNGGGWVQTSCHEKLDTEKGAEK